MGHSTVLFRGSKGRQNLGHVPHRREDRPRKVNHPNIATVYELFRDNDHLLMVMELVSGQTFEQLLDRTGPMPVERAASFAAQILDALGHAMRPPSI